jgi:hypothetical protein
MNSSAAKRSPFIVLKVVGWMAGASACRCRAGPRLSPRRDFNRAPADRTRGRCDQRTTASSLHFARTRSDSSHARGRSNANAITAGDQITVSHDAVRFARESIARNHTSCVFPRGNESGRAIASVRLDRGGIIPSEGGTLRRRPA